MAPKLRIHVEGSGSVFRTAERGVLHLRISATSETKTDASSAVQTTAHALTTKFRAHAFKDKDGAAHLLSGITAFNSSAISTSSHTPSVWNSSANRIIEGATRYTAVATQDVVFRDLVLLAQFSGELAAMEHVAIPHTEWRLTAATRAEIEKEARVKAIRDAVQKANDYAFVVGSRVVAVEISDVPGSHPGAGWHPGGMMQLQQQAVQQQQQQQQQQMPGGGGQSEGFVTEGRALEPTTITAFARVSVKFESVGGEDGDVVIE